MLGNIEHRTSNSQHRKWGGCVGIEDDDEGEHDCEVPCLAVGFCLR